MRCTIVLYFITAMAAANPPTSANSFATQLFQAIINERPNQNLIASPISIEACLALAYVGAEGETAKELSVILQQPLNADKRSIARKFSKLFEKTQSISTATFKLANRIYLDQRFRLSTQFNKIAENDFHSKVENVHFAEAAITAEKINTWVEQQTNNKIQQLITSNNLNANTAAILVNALYFKAKWLHQFDNHTTTKQKFSMSKTQIVEVDMMKQKDQFLYGEYEELAATAIEMKYADTDASMLIILPRTIDGLTVMESKLKDKDLIRLSDAMHTEEVVVHLPKFKFEFDISLKSLLEKLGVTSMFSDKADFNSLLANNEKITISEAKHKAFIEVNESGTEAAAATSLKFVPLSATFNQKIYQFVADHPFVFVIKDSENVYFVGHVTNF